MAYSTKTISTTGLQFLTAGARDVVSTAVVTITGVGTASMTFQSRHNVDGNGTNPLAPSNIGYSLLGGASVAAGVAITANGRWEVVTDGSDLYLNVTSLSAPFTVYITSLQGGGGGAGSGGGGGLSSVATATASPPTYTEGSSVTLSTNLAGALRVTAPATTVPLLVQGTDQTGSFFMPPQDAVGREGYQIVTGGAVAVAASAAGIKPVLTGGSDASGNVQTQPFVLPSAATSINTVAPFVMAQIGGRNSTSGVNAIGVVSLITDAVSGPASLSVGNSVFNGTTWDRQRGSAGDGTIIKPYAFSTSDWQYAGATGGITNTTGVTMKAAAGAGVRNYVTAIQLENSSVTATEVVVNDGAAGTALWRGYVPATSGVLLVTFPTPLKGTANTLTEVACVTTASATRVSAQGYAAA